MFSIGMAASNLQGDFVVPVTASSAKPLLMTLIGVATTMIRASLPIALTNLVSASAMMIYGRKSEKFKFKLMSRFPHLLITLLLIMQK